MQWGKKFPGIPEKRAYYITIQKQIQDQIITGFV